MLSAEKDNQLLTSHEVLLSHCFAIYYLFYCFNKISKSCILDRETFDTDLKTLSDQDRTILY